MQSKDIKTLYNASQEAEESLIPTLPYPGNFYCSITGLYGPTIDNKTVFSNYSDLAKAGKFIQKPVLTGSNIDETCLFSERGIIPIDMQAETTEEVFSCPINRVAQWRTEVGLKTWKYSWEGMLSISPSPPPNRVIILTTPSQQAGFRICTLPIARANPGTAAN